MREGRAMTSSEETMLTEARIKREKEEEDRTDSTVYPEQTKEPPQQRRGPWAVPPRRNLLRKTNVQTLKPKKRPAHTKNAFHLDLRNKWSQLVTDKISALAFARALKGHRCS